MKHQMNTEVLVSNKELAKWRLKIELAWQKSVEGVIEVGKLVKQAKDELGVSFTLLATELPFSSSVAAYLIKIAENPVLTNPEYFSRLPNSYNTLYHLTSVNEVQLIKQIENGEITPSFTLEKAKTLKADAPLIKSESKPGLHESKNSRQVTYEVGNIHITTTSNIESFQNELKILLEKYKGNITYTHKPSSLANFHEAKLLNKAYEKLNQYESQLQSINLDDLRLQPLLAKHQQITQLTK